VIGRPAIPAASPGLAAAAAVADADGHCDPPSRSSGANCGAEWKWAFRHSHLAASFAGYKKEDFLQFFKRFIKPVPYRSLDKINN
jgi:hypothetical protein